MEVNLQHLKKIGVCLAIASVFAACKKDDNEPRQSIRTKIEYSRISDTTTYGPANKLFVDANGSTTVSFADGNNRYKMLAAINTYCGLALKNSVTLDSVVLKDLYSNSGNPFTSTYHVDFAALNSSGVQLRNATAASWPALNAETVRKKIEAEFGNMAKISPSHGVVALDGTAGYLVNGNSKYLLDAKGVETAQVVQKSLIGAFQLDFIGNVLLDAGLSADNYTLVAGKNYTSLEHVWDMAFSTLTLNPNYLKGSTDNNRATAESFLGAYVWEYNKAGYAQVLPAFLKGRVAIVNNDEAELKAQASFIRTQFEIAIAKAALGYLDKSVATTATEGSRAHAFGEGLGFIYSLRFATKHGADAAFSDQILNDLLGAGGSFWNLTADKTNAAAAKIKAKFNIQ